MTDANGLVNMRARYYNPATMRFINSDPAMSDVNWYAYVGANPINRADPSGLAPFEITIGGSESHSWILTKDIATGDTHTYGRWKRGYGEAKDSGVHIDTEKRMNRVPSVTRTATVGELNIPINKGYEERSNNCSSYATQTWELNTGESLAARSIDNLWTYDSPSILSNSIKAANGGASSGVFYTQPASYSSPAPSILSPSSSSSSYSSSFGSATSTSNRK